MKNLKQYLCTLLVLSMLTGILPAKAIHLSDTPDTKRPDESTQAAITGDTAFGVCGPDLIWTLTSDGTLTISGRGEMNDYPNGSLMPWSQYRESITTIIIQDGVTSIDASAFSNFDNLTKATIAASVIDIGGRLFSDCEQMKTAGPVGGGYNIEYEWTEIPENAFMMCDALTYVYISETVTSVGENAFDHCYHLSSAGPGDGTFDPDTCTASYGIEFGWTDKIPDKAFLDCEVLTEITFPETLTTIGKRAFEASGLTGIMIPDSVTTIGDSAFEFSAITYIDIGSSLETIGSCVFANCLGLTDVTIPGTVRTIGYSAFDFCRNLKDVTLEEGVEAIGMYAFKNCPVDKIVLPTTITSIGVYALSAPSVRFLGNSPSDVGENAFVHDAILYRSRDSVWSHWFWYQNDCGEWVSVEDENSDQIAGQATFTWGPSSTSHWTVNAVYSPEFDTQPVSNVVYTGDPVTFTVSFTGVPMPDAQWQIDRGDGNGWVDIEGATSAAYIIDSADIACNGYRYRCVIENYGGIAVSEAVTLTVLNRLVASGDCGENLTWTLDRAGVLTISGEGVMDNYTSSSAIPWYDYRGDITALIIGDDVTSIGVSAFSFCEYLTDVTIGKNVVTISDYAFYNCSSLTDIFIPDSVTSINEGSFCNCTALASVIMGNGVTSIGYGAFQSCASLSAVTIPDSVTTLADQAFYNCTNLTSLTIGSGISAIGNLAFQYCKKLASVSIPEGVTTIGRQAFCYCYGLTTLTIPESVTVIGQYAFYDCDILETVCYGGIEKQWYEITIESGNECLTDSAFIFAAPEVIASGACGADDADLTWALTEDGTLTISGTGTMADFGLGEAPWNSNFELITNIVIQDGVTGISDHAFIFCTQLLTVTIPVSMMTIGDSVFGNCTKLETVYYDGDKVQWKSISIGKYNHPLLNAEITFAALPQIIMGDINEDSYVNSRDVIIILNAIAGHHTDTFTLLQTIAADINCDDSITIRDAILILQALASKTTDQL